MPLEALPDELVYGILACLNLKDALALGSTSKRLHALTVRLPPSPLTQHSIYHWGPRARASPFSWLLDLRSDEAWVAHVAKGVASARLVSDSCLRSGGHPPLTKLLVQGTNIVGLDPYGALWIIGKNREAGADADNGAVPWDAVTDYARISLPFAVVDFGVNSALVTVVTAEGEVWDFCSKWLCRGVTPALRQHLKAADACSAGGEEEAVKATRAVQALSVPEHVHTVHDCVERPCFMGGCVTADGRVHAWFQERRPGTGVPARGKAAIVSSDPLPGITMAARAAYHAVALTEDGAVWVSEMDVSKPKPQALPTKFNAWQKVRSLRAR
jgi:hypothetical protein